MKMVYKICLLIAAFFALGSVAWAGFNYESLNNYFIIDSVFKSGGNYIMVGNALDNSLITEGAAKTSDFFAVTNNLIFLNTDAKFCTIAGPSDNTCTGSRQIQKENGIYDFKTQKITINSSSDFGIFPKPDSPTLSLDAQKITIESNLFLNQESNYGSLTLTSDLAPIQSIYAPIVSANEIKILDINNNYIPISSGTKLSLISSIRPRYQRKITITNPLSVPLTDYQVAITIPEDLLSADKMRADGWDLQVYADVNRTQPPLLFFIDIMPKIWVKIPSISANGTKDIYITYGGQVNENPSDPKIFDPIWDGSKGVNLAVSFNFDEDATTAGNKTFESSLFGTTIFGTLRDNLPTAEMRIIGGGKINNGMKTVGHQMIEFNRSVNLGSEWTIETWFKTPLNGGTPYNILVRGKKDHIIMTADYLHGTYLLGTWEDPVKTGRDGWKPCDFNSSTPGIQGLDLNDPYFQANTWHHLIAVGKGLTTTFYIDSMMSPDSTELKKCVSNYKSMDDVMNIGNNDESDSRYSWGFIDDFRVYNNALEEEKIKTLADNCSFTTTALPGKILIKKCLSVPTVHEQEPTVVWEPIENEICIGYCTNDALRLGVVANADAITYSVSGVKKNFCYVEKLEKTDAASPLNFSNFTAIKALNGDEPDNTVNADANCTDTSAIEASARRACCQTGYYVFDFNASTDGKQEMVCCRYNNMVPCSLDKQCASPNKCIEGSCKIPPTTPTP